MQKNDIPIVFVHGYQANSGVWKPAQKFFIKNNYNNIHAFDYRNTTGNSIASNAKLLYQWLKENTLDKGPIILVAHSMGGLVARKMAADYPEINVVKLVTLATPNHGAKYAELCIIPITPPCPDAVLDMKPNSNFLNDLNGKTELLYTPVNVLTYAIKGDELVTQSSAYIETANTLFFGYSLSEVRGTSDIHSSIVTKEEVLQNTLDFIRKPHKIIDGGPRLHSGDCTIWLRNNGTIRWDVPSSSPNTLKMQICIVDKNEIKVITVPANNKVMEKLPNKTTIQLRLFDSSSNTVTQWSSVYFNIKGFRCTPKISNHPNIITRWGA